MYLYMIPFPESTLFIYLLHVFIFAVVVVVYLFVCYSIKMIIFHILPINIVTQFMNLRTSVRSFTFILCTHKQTKIITEAI